MIAKALHGQKLRGLIEYLFGEGKEEEHADPRLVAAWDPVVTRRQNYANDKAERDELTRAMEEPARLFGRDVPSGAVHHVPITLHVEDGQLTDEQWRQVAQVAADKLGFSADPEQGRAACPWVAVRHGLSKNGNDHIHLVANRVREDGSVASIHNERYKLAELRQEMEPYFELPHRTAGPGAGRAAAARNAAHAQTRARRFTPKQPTRVTSPTAEQRQQLARQVRAAANGANHEADFVHRMRRSGLLVRPRWAKGSRAEVVGYAVAAKPASRIESPAWSSGGKLARDLSLPALRQRWGQPTGEQQQAAVQAWRPPNWRRAGAQPPPAVALRTEAWNHAQQVVADARTQLSTVTPGDGTTWASAAREAAGTLSGLAERVGGARGRQLSRAADACAQAAVIEHGNPRGERAPQVSALAGAARVATDAWIAGQGGAVGAAQLVSQLQRLTGNIEQAHKAAGRAERAEHAKTASEQMLAYIRGDGLPHTPDVPAQQQTAGAVPHHRRAAPERNDRERGR